MLRSIDVSKHDAKDLVLAYEGRREGRVEYYKFLDDLAKKTKKSSSRGKSSRRMDTETKETMRVVRKFARKNERAMRSFKKEMQRIDRKDRGLVNKRAFKDEVFELGVDLSTSEYRGLEEFFYDEETGKVSYLDFYDEAMSQ